MAPPVSSCSSSVPWGREQVAGRSCTHQSAGQWRSRGWGGEIDRQIGSKSKASYRSGDERRAMERIGERERDRERERKKLKGDGKERKCVCVSLFLLFACVMEIKPKRNHFAFHSRLTFYANALLS